MTPKGEWPRSRVLLLKQWDRYPRSTERISCLVNFSHCHILLYFMTSILYFKFAVNCYDSIISISQSKQILIAPYVASKSNVDAVNFSCNETVLFRCYLLTLHSCCHYIYMIFYDFSVVLWILEWTDTVCLLILLTQSVVNLYILAAI